MPDPTPMTEAEARAQIASAAISYVQTHRRWAKLTRAEAVAETAGVILGESIHHHYGALALLLDWHELGKRATPEQLTALLRGAEEAGRVAPGLIGAWWRIVPDEEGAT